ncbi:hypothetical protein BS47DRAFT_1337086 [Hydnum rufescens UP504]|uniref:Uncharacterized protein n=1 Tax=Hydnum rufescens UP504 TaxID=1448309 RepID=A0A9P6B8R4_9AGAM|nr:hypothetical protein BS47DRAFT_1337086 [Hydnum rufescens UP504]
MALRKESAVKLNNKCQHNHWLISWHDWEDKDAAPHQRWTARAMINGREYAWGQGPKKGHAHDDAAVKVFNILGEDDSIAQLKNWLARFGWCLGWQTLPDAPSAAKLVWTATALVNGVPYGTGCSTFYTCAQEEAAKQALDRLNSEYSEI